MTARRTSRGVGTGFTLLEVMVSLSILALALTSVVGINVNSFEASNYAKHVTVATLLARSKMVDVEEILREDGFGDDDKEFSGDFSDEGYPGIRWVAMCRRVEVDVGRLINAFFGGDGEAKLEGLPEHMQLFIKALRGEGTEDFIQQVGGSELAKLLGGGMMENLVKQIGDTLESSMREISLEITWGKEGPEQESIRFVQYVTTSGRIAVAPETVPIGGPLPGDRNPNTLVPQSLPGGLPLPFGPGGSAAGGGAPPPQVIK